MTVARFTESFEMPNPNKLETLVSTAEQILSAVPETACYPRFVLEDRPYMHIADLEKVRSGEERYVINLFGKFPTS